MAEVWKMVAWLLREQFGWFLLVCAVAAVWLSALAMLLEYIVGEIRARIAVWSHNRMYREDWRHE